MPRENNFDAVRLLAAAVVIFGHAHPLTNTPGPALMGNSVQAIAVKIFFVISGYLICSSWIIDPKFARYMRKRALRIFPALAVICILTVFFIGPALTTLRASQYFGFLHTYGYFNNVLLKPVYDLPGVFADNTYPVAVNGSLWSLPVEFAMYLLMPVVYEVGRRTGIRSLMPIAALAMFALSIKFLRVSPPAVHPVFYGTDLLSALDVAPYFMIGASIKHLDFDRFIDPVFALFLAGLVALVPPESGTWCEIVLFLVLPYCVLALALSAHRILSRVGRFGDFSYGLYLYGFLVQQCVGHFMNNHVTAIGNALISLPIALVCAIVSWHVIEKPMLKLKPRPRLSTADVPVKEIING